MTDQRTDQQQLMQKALLELRDMRSRLKASEDAKAEPIAIVGIGCRIPGGADSPESFWRLLIEGQDVITEVPAERWDIDAYYDPEPGRPGKMYARHGSFLPSIDRFDADFFAISPKEARSLDPQQRLLLEVSWEALEHANQAPDQLFGSSTGVFVGIGGLDYSALQAETLAPGNIDAYFATGNALCVAAGRLSYILGLTGPSLSVDTACSSSLVVIHLAVRSLRQRECDMALAGGVNLVLRPELYINFCQARMLAPDGRCKTFDAAANGYVRGEGCGMVVLKRLSDAETDGDHILAVITGSAVNQDGASGGLTVPSGPSQEQVIRRALADSNIKPEQVSYVEAHGTGTSLGDPIEIGAIHQVFGKRDQPLLVGSVKTNIGHLESASGIAGFIKVVLSLQHGLIPPNLHFHDPNPRIPWERISVNIPTRVSPWPASETRIAGVSSFGFSGTNAHVVLRDYRHAADESTPTPVPVQPPYLLTLSAKSESALKQLSERYVQYLHDAQASTTVGDICYTASTGRSHFQHRLAVIGESAVDLGARLMEFQSGKTAPEICTGRPTQASQPVFLFTGQGAQYPGMGRELYDTEPRFRQTLDDCSDMLQDTLDRPLRQVLYPESGDETPTRLNETAYTQPALFALAYSMVELWASWGVRPAAVMGHSVGEYVAACVAGVFSLEDGLQLIAERGRLMQALPPDGAMLALMAGEDRMQDIIEPYLQTVSIAAVNGPHSVVLSGSRHTLDLLQQNLVRQGIRCQPLTVSHAFHSPLMDPVLEPFREAAAAITFAAPKMYLISNLTGSFAAEEIATADYWVRHIRRPVRFADGMHTLRQAGYERFVEVGPRPALLGLGRQCFPDNFGVWLPSIRPHKDRHQWFRSLAALYSQGVPVRCSTQKQRRYVSLPTYPFQRQRYWFKDSTLPSRRQPQIPARGHPVLGRRLQSALRDVQFESQLSARSPAYLDQHRIFGKVVVPAATFLETAYAAGAEVMKTDQVVVDHSMIQQALILPEAGYKTIQTILTPQGDHCFAWQIFSLAASEDEAGQAWVLHASGVVRAADDAYSAPIDLQRLRQTMDGETSSEDFYRQFSARGIEYGMGFQTIARVFHAEGEALARIDLNHLYEHAPDGYRDYVLHPAILDACLQVGSATLPDTNTDVTFLPVGIERLQMWRTSLHTPLWCHATLQPKHDTQQSFDVALCLFDDNGERVARIEGVVAQATNRHVLLKSLQPDLKQFLYEVVWQPQPDAISVVTGASETMRKGNWLLLADDPQLGQQVTTYLIQQGESAVLVASDDLSSSRIPFYRMDPLCPDDYQRTLRDLAPVAGVFRLFDNNARNCHATSNDALASTLYLVQALIETDSQQPPRLWLITRGAQPVGVDLPRLALYQAPVWGLGAVIAREHPEFNCVRVDLDPGEDQHGKHVYEMLQSTGLEDRLAWRGGIRHVARLEPRTHVGEANIIRPNQHVQLTTTGAGSLDNLVLSPLTRRQPGPDEVEIRVRAAGLNFRDVLRALGMLQGHPAGLVAPIDGELPFGIECSGTIATVGEHVRTFKTGDDVVAVLAVGSLGNFATVRADFVALKPTNLTFTEAATVPLAFLTAHYGLNHLAHLRPGERVLIHAAAGGVGLAAVQLAHQVGAEVFATAHPTKWAFLKSLGISNVMHSRNLDFAEQISSLTHGQGVDVVLNSLNGEFIPKSIESCARQARFVEIGKIGIWDHQRMLAARPDITYFPFDLGEVADERPGLITTLLHEVLQGLSEGALNPLRQQVFPLHDAAQAFRLMARTEHIGKIVLQPSLAEAPPQIPGQPLCAAGTHLITGGLGALGLAVAQWMVREGARHLILIGRSPAKPKARQAIERMRESGAEIVVKCVDVTARSEVSDLFEDIKARMPTLKGVIHAAGVLADGMLSQQHWEPYRRVLAPKVNGAWHLHELSRDFPLEYFIMFSSASSLLGNPGQGAYAAANAFLDALAFYRRANGLTAQTINWGPWSEAGMATTVVNSASRLLGQGVRSLAPEDGLAILKLIFNDGNPQTCVLDVDWPAYVRRLADLSPPPFFANLVEPPVHAPSMPAASQQPDLLARLQREVPVMREKAVLTLIQDVAKEVMGHAQTHTIASDRPLMEQGIDSLMAVELRNKLSSAVHTTLPASLIFDYPTLEKIRDFLLAEVLSFDDPATQPATASAPATLDPASAEDVLAEIDRLLGMSKNDDTQ